MLPRLQLARLYRSVRWPDVIVLQGAPLLGLAFSVGPVTSAKLTMSISFGLASLLLMIHVFTFNDWADFTRGVHHSDPATLELERSNINPQALLAFSLLQLGASYLLFLLLSERCSLLAILIAALGILYSHPSLNAKSVPIVSTLLHFMGGIFHFLLGYTFFSAIDQRGVLIGFFFGLTFAAGHPVQEVRDVLEDSHAGAKTNAIVFGQLPCFIAGLILFTSQYLYLFWLAWSGFIPRPLVILSFACYAIHMWWAVLTLRGDLTAASITRFEKRYRVLYVTIGLVLLWSSLG